MNRLPVPPLPKKPSKPYIAKAMTIGLGFSCVNGIVLCSDSQITSRGTGTKFKEQKIHPISSLGGEVYWTVALTYAGDQAMFKSFYEQVSNTLSPFGTEISLEFLRKTIQDALFTVHGNTLNADTEYIDVICAISLRNSGSESSETQMLVGKRTTLHVETGIAFVGIGDSSLSRFLADILPTDMRGLGVKEALILGAYIIDQAKNFIDGCGGETQTLIVVDGSTSSLHDYGQKITFDEKAFEIARVTHECVRDLFRALIDGERETRQVEEAIRSIKAQVNAFYSLPT